MLSETNGLPIGGGLLLAIIIYALFSLFVSGQVIGERSIARSNWDGQCRATLLSEIEAKRPARSLPIPRPGCVFKIFGSDGERLCRRYGNPDIFGSVFDQLEAVERRKRKLIEQRLAQAAARSGSKCDCAKSLTLEKSRIPLAIWAGSVRLVTPPSIKNLNAELLSALHSPQCAMKG